MTTYLVNFLTGIFESISILMFIEAYSEKRSSISKHKYIFALAMLSFMINLSNMVLNLGMMNFILVTISTFLVSFIYNRNIKMNLIISFMPVLILGISEIVVLFLITVFADITVKEAAEINDYVILGIILSKLFAFFALKFFCVKYRSNDILNMKTSYWLLFLLMFIISTMTIFLIFKLQYKSRTITMYNLSIFCSVGLLYTTFIALYLFENLSKQAQLESRQEIFAQQIKAQSKHLDEILVTQEEIKKIRHDMVNHNISIRAYFENHDYQEGLKYMDNMFKLTENSSDMIETGNIALDSIINTKRRIAKSKNIEFKTSIQIPENIFVNPIDICIIFGNALDNAIEACEKIQEDKKKIMVSVIYEDNSLICKIINTSLKGYGRFLKSTKKDIKNHGFGIKNIESALSKYKNVCRFKQTEGEFILSFIIFNN